jgi:hypothetical protein
MSISGSGTPRQKRSAKVSAPPNQGGEHTIAEERRRADPETGGGEQLGVPTADPPEREQGKGHDERRNREPEMEADLRPAEAHQGCGDEKAGDEHQSDPVRHRHGEEVGGSRQGHGAGKDGEQEEVLDHLSF